MLTDTTNSHYARVYGVPYGNVKLRGGFWKECMDMCADGMIKQIHRMFESNEISHVVENFRICAGENTGRHRGTPFGDGDFYKWMEAALYCADYKQDNELHEQIEDYITLIIKAQRPDGYISTKQIINEMNGVNTRQKDINEFEIYNFGHLFTLACLYTRVTGKKRFLQIAEKAAVYLEKMYENAEKNGDVQTAVCPSNYMGLVELYRTTGNKRYLCLAEKSIRLRDQVKNGTDDNQDRIPLAEHKSIMGHAVRANYLYAGLADLYAEKGEQTDWKVLHHVWENLITKKLYITGGCGALYNGVSPYGKFPHDEKIHQAYGYEYQLPNITAYNETCASVGGVMWAYRMFTIEPKAIYMDVLERMMYNVNLAAVSLDGKKFFYENMLRRTKTLDYELMWPRERTEYITSYCCPPNLARLISQISEYMYMVSKDSVWAGIYGDSTVHLNLGNGASFLLKQETEYPYDGVIKFSFEDVKCDNPWNLKLRIPSWAEGGIVIVNGKTKKLSIGDAGTYYNIYVEDTSHMEVILELDMPVRLSVANSMVEEAENHVAVERGPLVYCMESNDTELETLDDIVVPINAEFTLQEMVIQERKVMSLNSQFLYVKRNLDRNALYQTLHLEQKEKVNVRMIPYFAWDNRGMGEMRIWFPANY